MEKADRVSFLKSTIAGLEKNLEAVKAQAKDTDVRTARAAHGALNDAEQRLHMHRHELKELTDAR